MTHYPASQACTSSPGAHCNSTKGHFACCLSQNACINGRPVEVTKLEPLQGESHIPKLVHRCIHAKGSHIHSIKGWQPILSEAHIVVAFQSRSVVVGEGVCALRQDACTVQTVTGQTKSLNCSTNHHTTSATIMSIAWTQHRNNYVLRCSLFKVAHVWGVFWPNDTYTYAHCNHGNLPILIIQVPSNILCTISYKTSQPYKLSLINLTNNLNKVQDVLTQRSLYKLLNNTQYIIGHVTMATYPSWYSNDAGVSWADWVVSTNGIVQDCLNVTQWAAGGSVKHMETDTSPTCTLPSCIEKWHSNNWIFLQPDQVRTLMSPNNGKTEALSFAWWMPEEVITGWHK